MKKTAQEIVNAMIAGARLAPDGSFGSVIHYQISLYDEEADIGEQVAELMYKEFSGRYPSSDVEVKTWPAPNHELNIRISVKRR